MATNYIGDQTWGRTVGDTEQNGEDGSITTTRYYMGPKSGWSAFKAAYPIGTSDPVYGNDVRSISAPSITRSGKAYYTAAITFRGGLFDGDTDTAPQVSVSKASRTIEVEHGAGEVVRLTYRAWQTVVTYVRKGTPSTSGSYASLAYNGNVDPINTDTIQQELVTELAEGGTFTNMTTAELQAAVAQGTRALDDISWTRRTADDGTPIYDVTETWIRGLIEA